MVAVASIVGVRVGSIPFLRLRIHAKCHLGDDREAWTVVDRKLLRNGIVTIVGPMEAQSQQVTNLNPNHVQRNY